jgi:hypothetical protein
MQRQALPAPGARQIAVQISGGALPARRQKADDPVRLAVVTTQGVIELAVAVRMMA